jgi:S-adenosylmethionine decarboxylase
MLDESHCSVHTYAELGLLAMDIFTCGDTDPKRIWERIQEALHLDHASIREYPPF